MPVVDTSITFQDNDQVTASKLNSIMDNSSFVSGAVVSGSGLQITAGGQMQIGDGSNGITTAKIADLNVTTAKIADLAVTTGKMADLAITTGKVADSAITTVKIADSTSTSTGVTTAKLANSSVTADKIADSTITASKLSGGQTGSAPAFAARAFGTIELGTSSRTVQPGAKNIASASRPAATDTSVTFTTAMPDANYVVMATYQVNLSIATSISIYEKTTSGFKMKHLDDSNGRYVQVAVFG